MWGDGVGVGDECVCGGVEVGVVIASEVPWGFLSPPS